MKAIVTKELTKKFGNFIANDSIDLTVEEGEIHAIIGENGAGKSTLMNMLFGLLEPSEGNIYIRGQEVKITSPKVAIELGIGMVHQHFKLVPSLSIADNILLGNELVKGGLIDKKKGLKEIQSLINEYKFDMDPKAKIQDISVGGQQRVEILKMLYRDVDILIFDEPTAVLTPTEVKDFLNRLQELKRKGKTIIIITHKLNEVKISSDTVSVIKSGKLIHTVKTKEVNEKDLAHLMVGREVVLRVEKGESHPKNIVYKVENLSTNDYRGVKVLNEVSFNVRAGEVLGIAGVEGNGQSELMKVMSGLMISTGGSIRFFDKDITNLTPKKIKANGIGIVPEDRYEHGLCKSMSLTKNSVIGYHDQKPYCSNYIMDYKGIKKHAEKLIQEFDIRTSSPDIDAGQLSGGNAQKVVIAREMAMQPDLLILSQPTRGVDIGSIEFIHQQIIKSRDQGKAVIVISSELSEVLNLSDRVIVLYKGEVIEELPIKKATTEKIGSLMAGIKFVG